MARFKLPLLLLACATACSREAGAPIDALGSRTALGCRTFGFKARHGCEEQKGSSVDGRPLYACGKGPRAFRAAWDAQGRLAFLAFDRSPGAEDLFDASLEANTRTLGPSLKTTEEGAECPFRVSRYEAGGLKVREYSSADCGGQAAGLAYSVDRGLGPE